MLLPHIGQNVGQHIGPASAHSGRSGLAMGLLILPDHFLYTAQAGKW